MARRRFQSPVQDAAQGEKVCDKDADSEDDAAKTESQQMLALRPLPKNSKSADKGLQQFRVKVTADQKQTIALLEQRVLHTENEERSRRNEIATMIVEALKTPNQPTHDGEPTFSGTRIAGNIVYTSVADVLTASEWLITEYRRLDNIIKDLQNERVESVADTWKQDIDMTERQLKMGARVALRSVKKVLGADVESEELAVIDEDGDENMEGLEGEEKELDYELYKSLRYAERGVKRMVKGLPDDEAN